MDFKRTYTLDKKIQQQRNNRKNPVKVQYITLKMYRKTLIPYRSFLYISTQEIQF